MGTLIMIDPVEADEQPGVYGDPLLTGVVDAVVEHHHAIHDGTFRFCREEPCKGVREALGGPGGDLG